MQLADAVERDVDVEVELGAALAAGPSRSTRCAPSCCRWSGCRRSGTPVFLWKILTISPMSLRRNGSPPVGSRNIRLPLPMLAVTLSISSRESSCLRYAIDGFSQSGMRAVGEQAVLALRVAGVGDEVHQVHRHLALLEEHLLAVLAGNPSNPLRDVSLSCRSSSVARTGYVSEADAPFRRRRRAARARAAAPRPAHVPQPSLRRIASRKPRIEADDREPASDARSRSPSAEPTSSEPDGKHGEARERDAGDVARRHRGVVLPEVVGGGGA